jgi:hypothetical protein
MFTKLYEFSKISRAKGGPFETQSTFRSSGCPDGQRIMIATNVVKGELWQDRESILKG